MMKLFKDNRVVQEPDNIGPKYRACFEHMRGVIMKIGVPMEPEGETRVAIVPGSMKKLMKSGFEVDVQKLSLIHISEPTRPY